MIKIGFIGLGHMGNPMVHNLLKAGHEVHVYDVVPAAVAAVTKDGAIAESHLEELTEKCSVFIIAFDRTTSGKVCCLHANGLFSHTKPLVIY